LPPPEAAALLEKLALAMQAAHDKGVIHRDLKPANVLLAEDGSPKITDFGLAKKLDEASQTNTGSVMGTPSYMAPEQAEGKKDIGPACDVYALGAILYELLTGRPPFKAATPLDTILQVVADEPAPARQLNAQVPRDLETVCLKCLEKAPQRRYATARDLAQDLHRYLAGEPVQARPVCSWERAWKWAKRRPALATLFAVIVLAALSLLGGGLGFTAALAEQRNQALQAQDDAERARNEAQQRALQEKELRQAVEQQKAEKEKQLLRSEWLLYTSQIALAQREWQDGEVLHARDLLDACRRDFRGWEHAYLHHLFNETQQTFRGHTQFVYSVSFSPDGKRLASASGDPFDHNKPGEVKVWDAHTGQHVRTLKGHTGDVLSVCFSPDGKRLASASWDKTVKVWDAASGQQIHTLKGHTEPVSSVCFSPDGKRLASASRDQTVKVWDAQTGQGTLTLKGHTSEVSSVCFSPDGKRLASASDDQTVKVWDAASGKEVLSLQGHTGPVTSVCFSPDGKRLASASFDNAVKLWDAATGQEVLSLKGHTHYVTSLSFSADGRRLASASWDWTVKVWDGETSVAARR
jgi:hypothetical protein